MTLKLSSLHASASSDGFYISLHDDRGAAVDQGARTSRFVDHEDISAGSAPAMLLASIADAVAIDDLDAIRGRLHAWDAAIEAYQEDAR